MRGIYRPGYLRMADEGSLRSRVEEAWAHLRACDLCPRHCGVDRVAGETGYCRAGVTVRLASANIHIWEEPPISGTGGSGTLFFSYCTARCIFCQNYPISQLGVGGDLEIAELAEKMLYLQRQGCHNVNLVTAAHYVPQVLAAVERAATQGLHIPLVYNSSGYDSLETLRLLDGVVDLYLPDSKYADDTVAWRISRFSDYVRHNRAALREIHRQVGDDLVLDDEGIAVRGMIVRHLVLPDGLSQTPEVLEWIAKNLSNEVHISLMSQYFPAHHAVRHPVLNRRLTQEEYDVAVAAPDALGLENGWRQEMDPLY